ncbi:hypothetical protein CG723_41025 [Streptomyces sp. CB01635]|uniref:hypothetical protein n=1 Tax=unclassified Streptomyces TaxID=2593676 RepID=UPI000C276907|nr:hypothetical protein [Streptomyces sp. CB01635]PJN06127.1 hypothetical protein CG723_41025 [Streptomyces sp. CB01635]
MTDGDRPVDPNDDPATAAKRLTIDSKVLRELYLLSGNECAWPGCTVPLAPDEGGMLGEIAHIRAAESGGARFDPGMTNNERRAFTNLVLLCPTHHTLIDHVGSRHRFDWACLEDVKHRHESRFRRALDCLERTEEQYIDQTRATTVVHCTTLRRMYGDLLGEEDRKGTAESVNQIADQLRRAVPAARQLLSMLVEENQEISVAEAADRGGLTQERIRELVRQLDRLWFAALLPEEYDDPDILPERITLRDSVWDHNPVFDGYAFWDDLRRHVAEREDLTFADMIVGLNFSLLD